MTTVDILPTNPGRQLVVDLFMKYLVVSNSEKCPTETKKSTKLIACSCICLVQDPETSAASVVSADKRKERAKPSCSVGKNLVKGYKNVTNFPKNKQID